jgi:GT2 family glycosyltransferase
MAQPGSVSAVIPNWNQAELLRRVLADLGRQTCPLDQVVVVDNGSTDSSPEVARKAGAHLIRFSRNEGFASAVNRGVADCRSEWVLVLNNDVSFGPDWVGILLEGASSAKAWFAVGKLLSAARPEIIDGTFDAISRGGTAWRCGSGRPDGPAWSRAKQIVFPSLTAALVRSELFERVGLLDERFESYLEDVDFGLRCAARHYNGVYVPQAVAHHAGSATLGAWHKATVQRISRNQVLLVKKHFRGAPRLPIMAAQLLWGLLALRHGTGCAWMRGKMDGLRYSPAEPAGEWAEIRTVIENSEAEIRDLQMATGFDLYWKLYFALVGTRPCVT